jgi:hypothetical protein
VERQSEKGRFREDSRLTDQKGPVARCRTGLQVGGWGLGGFAESGFFRRVTLERRDATCGGSERERERERKEEEMGWIETRKGRKKTS